MTAPPLLLRPCHVAPRSLGQTFQRVRGKQKLTRNHQQQETSRLKTRYLRLPPSAEPSTRKTTRLYYHQYGANAHSACIPISSEPSRRKRRHISQIQQSASCRLSMMRIGMYRSISSRVALDVLCLLHMKDASPICESSRAVCTISHVTHVPMNPCIRSLTHRISRISSLQLALFTVQLSARQSTSTSTFEI